ncbi:lycopene cyclase domain-containing protein [Arthrobacter crystallopoietes]|uniref:lycopene cyclase domain-containing protein n=1 Tax=Crystallibacter crystallopoietes TaxID=37928 RepID=UPI001ABDBB38|nr:lycopene cyclase domain-containing protein [Arthrobacter crystallopoietes]QTG82507.1 lycopene cyclase domain-containing protein [Arthrobacter crystallopoietes]
MTYLLLNLGFLALAAAMALVAALVHRRRQAVSGLPAGRPRKVIAAVVLGFLVLCVLTAVFDNLMIAVGLFEYSAEHTSGWRIGLAPLEDFAYVLAAAVLLPAVWILLPGGKGAHDE